MQFSHILLILIAIALCILSFIIGKWVGKWQSKRDMSTVIQEHRKDAVKRSRATLSGQFTEQLAPYLPNFPYKPTEARFIGKPIDFLVFKGADEQNISEVIFVEVKSGSSTLSAQEQKLKSAIQNKKVKWEQYDVEYE